MTIIYSNIFIKIRLDSLNSIRKRNARKKKLIWMLSQITIGYQLFIELMKEWHLEMKAKRMLIKANVRPREARCSRNTSSANHYLFATTVATTCGF